MRVTTLYLNGTAEALSRMTAPIPDPPGQPTPQATAALAAAREAATEAAWDAFERATFPELTRRSTTP